MLKQYINVNILRERCLVKDTTCRRSGGLRKVVAAVFAVAFVVSIMTTQKAWRYDARASKIPRSGIRYR